MQCARPLRAGEAGEGVVASLGTLVSGECRASAPIGGPGDGIQDTHRAFHSNLVLFFNILCFAFVQSLNRTQDTGKARFESAQSCISPWSMTAITDILESHIPEDASPLSLSLSPVGAADSPSTHHSTPRRSGPSSGGLPGHSPPLGPRLRYGSQAHSVWQNHASSTAVSPAQSPPGSVPVSPRNSVDGTYPIMSPKRRSLLLAVPCHCQQRDWWLE